MTDLARRVPRPFGQLPHLIGDNGKSTPLLSGTRSLDGRIQGEQIGLVGNFLDHLHDH